MAIDGQGQEGLANVFKKNEEFHFGTVWELPYNSFGQNISHLELFTVSLKTIEVGKVLNFNLPEVWKTCRIDPMHS